MSEIRQALVIARREFLERVRTKWFAAVTLLGPIGFAAMIVIPVLIAGQTTSGSRLQIADATGELGEKLAPALETGLHWTVTSVPADTSDETLRARIAKSEINGYLRIPKDAVDGGEIVYSGDNASSTAVSAALHAAITATIQLERGSRMHLTPEQIAAITEPANFRALHTTGESKGASGAATYVIGYLLAFILYFVITLYCASVMRSVVQEKSSRVMELMCAAAKPRVLLSGKILGVGGAGLLQILLWMVMGGVMISYREQLLGLFGVHGAGAAMALPEIAVSQLVVFILYFIVGYFFYSAMFAAAGSMVSSEQDIQQVQMPITLLLVIGMVCINIVSNDPRGGASVTMTNLPLWSPMLMPMRYVLGGATLGEVLLSLGILVASTAIMVAIAARIYRVGVLMYGKRPSLGEIARWIRHG